MTQILDTRPAHLKWGRAIASQRFWGWLFFGRGTVAGCRRQYSQRPSGQPFLAQRFLREAIDSVTRGVAV